MPDILELQRNCLGLATDDVLRARVRSARQAMETLTAETIDDDDDDDDIDVDNENAESIATDENTYDPGDTECTEDMQTNFVRNVDSLRKALS